MIFLSSLYVYHDNHMLADDVVEIDFVINAALWLLDNISDKPVKENKPKIIAQEVPKKEA